jgi:hypothetical protein
MACVKIVWKSHGCVTLNHLAAPAALGSTVQHRYTWTDSIEKKKKRIDMTVFLTDSQTII